MATNPNMVAIETVTVPSGGAASIEFTSIPATYTDLVLKISARTDVAGANRTTINFKFNNSTASQSMRTLFGYETPPVESSTYTDLRLSVPAAGATASTFGNAELYVPNYAGSNSKSVSVDSVNENNSSTAYLIGFWAGLWSNSAAITSITFTPASGNFVQYSTATLYGVTSAAVGAKATGGIITSDANYYYHTFPASGTFTPTSNITADYLVVAGGGGSNIASSTPSGGSGAGGLRSTVTATGGGGSLESPVSFTNGTAYTITVGAGGAGNNTNNGATNNGSNSSISGSGLTTITSIGGGGGDWGIGSASTGGSGGGGRFTANGAAGTANQGYAGGNAGGSSGNQGSGGGGGASAVGANGTSTNGGNGGAGVAVSITGSSVTYAGGGGGSTYNGGVVGSGGAGGGGNGGTGGTPGASGGVNTGGGAGGTGSTGGAGPTGSGGSGIVIVRYPK
jgi:hypothetical protein